MSYPGQRVTKAHSQG